MTIKMKETISTLCFVKRFHRFDLDMYKSFMVSRCSWSDTLGLPVSSFTLLWIKWTHSTRRFLESK